jgi:hypothetical protein
LPIKIRPLFPGVVFGVGIYFVDGSEVATAALHARLVRYNESATVYVQYAGIQPYFYGATSNDVLGRALQSSGRGFVLSLSATLAPQQPMSTVPFVIDALVERVPAGVECYGAGVYSAQTDVAIAALHNGVLDFGVVTRLYVWPVPPGPFGSRNLVGATSRGIGCYCGYASRSFVVSNAPSMPYVETEWWIQRDNITARSNSMVSQPTAPPAMPTPPDAHGGSKSSNSTSTKRTQEATAVVAQVLHEPYPVHNAWRVASSS